MSKQKWIEEVLLSAKGMQPAEADPFLPVRVQAKLERLRAATVRMPRRWAYALAAMIAVLVVFNISIWRGVGHSRSNNGLQQVMQEYGWSSQDIYMNFPK